jgi:LAGLIDADG endonuclease
VPKVGIPLSRQRGAAPHAGDSVMSSRLYAGKPVYPPLLAGHGCHRYFVPFQAMSGSDNVRGAENQQERLWTNGWVVGFVDGEGCFSCPIFHNKSMTTGWQVQPQFVVVQSASSSDVLEDLARFFGCGKVYVNRRYDNHREDLFRYCVSRFSDIRDIVVPYFEHNELRTSKKYNFEKFAQVIRLMDQGGHLTRPRLIEIAQIAETMNHRKPSQVLRILRDHTPTNSEPIGPS